MTWPQWHSNASCQIKKCPCISRLSGKIHNAHTAINIFPYHSHLRSKFHYEMTISQSVRYTTCYWLCIHILQSHGFEDKIYPSPQSQSQIQISYVMSVLWAGHCGTTPLWGLDLLQGSVYTQSGLSLHLSDHPNSVNRRTRNYSLCAQKQGNYHTFFEVLLVQSFNKLIPGYVMWTAAFVPLSFQHIPAQRWFQPCPTCWWLGKCKSQSLLFWCLGSPTRPYQKHEQFWYDGLQGNRYYFMSSYHSLNPWQPSLKWNHSSESSSHQACKTLTHIPALNWSATFQTHVCQLLTITDFYYTTLRDKQVYGRNRKSSTLQCPD